MSLAHSHSNSILVVMKFLAHVPSSHRQFCWEPTCLWLFSVWLLVLANTGAAVSISSPGAGSESDRLALLAFKFQIEDPLGALTSWNDSFHHCDWRGITCSRQHRDRVTILDLHNLKLGGTLSPSVGNLTFLESLTLSENNFLGEIPQEIGHLIHLQDLSLDTNSFEGEIPNNLTHCPELRYINLNANKLYGNIPDSLTSLSKLTDLGLADNDFNGNIPPSLGNLSSLVQLSLARNRLEGRIPDDMCQTQSLNFVLLSENNLTGEVPPCLYNLSYLSFLTLSSNQLEGSLPPNIGLTLPNIQGMYFGLNMFTGAIPVSVSNATQLRVIAFDGNYFSGSVPKDLGRLSGLERINFNENLFGTRQADDLQFITSLTNCSNLNWVEFQGNFLSGPLPDTLSNLSTKIQWFEAGDNHIYGSIPSGIGNLVMIEHLNLQNNRLSEHIPFEIGRLKKLVQIRLQGNRLSREIPSSLGNLTKLTHLYLGNNSLSGSIPSSLAQCHNLLLLNLSHNNLIGTIPKQVIGLPSLAIGLHLQQNSLRGSLPSQVGELINCVTLDISENKLSGPIPDSLGRCLNLEYLFMGGNSFEGAIPISLGALKGLQHFDLSRNKLTGEIPEYLEKFPLRNLNLSFNQFEGVVPHDGVFRNVTSFSVDGNKNLCGGVEELKLIPCFQKRRNNSSLKVILLTVGGSLCLIGFVILACYKGDILKRKSSSTTACDQEDDRRLSYAELHAATDGFSADNLIGFGSHGSIYKGFLSELDKTVAVKVFNFLQRESSKGFLTECNTLRYLRHRNLVKILTICSSMDFQRKDFSAIVFDFMSNGSLEDLLYQGADEKKSQSKCLTFKQILNIAIDIASAIEYLHHFVPAVVHCDLKPSNILFDDDMVAHVADFGIAKTSCVTSSNASQSQTSSLAVRGTIGYVAPEYGIGGKVSTQGDVYSYGILLLEMFTKKKPTDNIFQNGLCLHNYAAMLLQNQVMEDWDLDETALLEDKGTTKDSLKECLALVIRVGVACSAESPAERPTMREVRTELCNIRDHLHQEA